MLHLRIKRKDAPAVTVTEIDRPTAKLLHEEFNASLDSFCRKYGLSRQPTRVRFGKYTFSCRVELILKAQEGKVKEQSNLWKPHDCKYKVGDLVSVRGKLNTVYCIIEFRRSGKCNIKRVPDGKMFNCWPRILCEPYGGK
jgi:hypothetical protein